MRRNVEYKVSDNSKELYLEYYKYFDHLFAKARDNSGLDYVFTLLRVSGIQDGGWDPFEESQEALLDYSRLLQRTSKNGINKRSFRLALLIYCHTVELSVPYHIFFNLLRCVQHSTYVPFPFPGTPIKRKLFGVKPQTPAQKIRALRTECEKVKETDLVDKIDTFYDDEIRNAFYHSDYVLTDTEFRICEGGLPKSVSFSDLSEKLARCFAFYQAFFDIYKKIRLAFLSGKKYYRMPNFEVCEILTNKKQGLIGFRIHFSNGSSAFFERRKERVTGINVMLENDHINFFCGNLATLKPKWLLNGKKFVEKNTRYNKEGYWKPLLFLGDVQSIMKEIGLLSPDEDVRACLFYIRLTGSESIEFALKTNEKLFESDLYSEGRFSVAKCAISKEGMYVYDCTYFVNSEKPLEIRKGLNRIKKFVAEKTAGMSESSYCLKYTLRRNVRPTKNSDGTMTISFSMDDPRNTLTVSNFRMLPKTDWSIKPEWID